MLSRSGMGLEIVHFSGAPNEAKAAGLWAVVGVARYPRETEKEGRKLVWLVTSVLPSHTRQMVLSVQETHHGFT